MKVRIKSSVIVPALIVTAFSSLLILVMLTQIDQIVSSVLYDFGLQFSYRWTWPYWTHSGIVITLTWFNILAAIGLTYYLYKGQRHLVEGREEEDAMDRQKHLGEYSGDAGVEKGEEELTPDLSVASPVESEEELIEAQISISPLQKLEIKRYDVRRPKDIIDSQC